MTVIELTTLQLKGENTPTFETLCHHVLGSYEAAGSQRQIVDQTLKKLWHHHKQCKLKL